MKILIGFIFSFSTSAFAQDPSQICESSACSEPMLKISEAYKNGHVDFLKAPLSAYSGKCYHQDPNYDPDHAHYGVMAFQPSQNTFQMTGFFGFFYEEDPYAKSNSEEILKDLLTRGYKWIPGKITADSAEIVISMPTAEIKYWIRSQEKSEHIFLIGQWTGAGQSFWQTAMFCDLKTRD